jgi:hypothetical protein
MNRLLPCLLVFVVTFALGCATSQSEATASTPTSPLPDCTSTAQAPSGPVRPIATGPIDASAPPLTREDADADEKRVIPAPLPDQLRAKRLPMGPMPMPTPCRPSTEGRPADVPPTPAPLPPLKN